MEFELSQRLQKLPPYPFAALRGKIAMARQRGVKVISLGIGDPDMPAADAVVAELCRAVQDESDADRHRYGCDQPVAAFTDAARDFYRRRWGVALSADQVVATSGSKDAIAQLSMAMLNPGDVAITPSPGYPTYNIGHVFAGATTYPVTLRPRDGFLLDFDAVPSEVRRQARIMWLNYPNNPTTATAELEYFQRAVEFGRRNDILIAHDNAYSENTYDGYRSPSILQVPGAHEAAVEFFSLSKAFCMTGWRVGFMAGNVSAVKALRLVKENTDNGTLRAVQFAGAKALNLAETLIPPINAIYSRRRDLVVDALNASGWSLRKPKATIYVWAPVPPKYKNSSADFASDLIEKTGVFVTPGLSYGRDGEGFFRISLTYPDAVIQEAVGRIAQMRL